MHSTSVDQDHRKAQIDQLNMELWGIPASSSTPNKQPTPQQQRVNQAASTSLNHKNEEDMTLTDFIEQAEVKSRSFPLKFRLKKTNGSTGSPKQKKRKSPSSSSKQTTTTRGSRSQNPENTTAPTTPRAKRRKLNGSTNPPRKSPLPKAHKLLEELTSSLYKTDSWSAERQRTLTNVRQQANRYKKLHEKEQKEIKALKAKLAKTDQPDLIQKLKDAGRKLIKARDEAKKTLEDSEKKCEILEKRVIHLTKQLKKTKTQTAKDKQEMQNQVQDFFTQLGLSGAAK